MVVDADGVCGSDKAGDEVEGIFALGPGSDLKVDAGGNGGRLLQRGDNECRIAGRGENQAREPFERKCGVTGEIAKISPRCDHERVDTFVAGNFLSAYQT